MKQPLKLILPGPVRLVNYRYFGLRFRQVGSAFDHSATTPPLDPTSPPKRNCFAAVSTTTAKKHFRQNDEDDLKVFTAERRQTDKHSEEKS